MIRTRNTLHLCPMESGSGVGLVQAIGVLIFKVKEHHGEIQIMTGSGLYPYESEATIRHQLHFCSISLSNDTRDLSSYQSSGSYAK